ncbi:TPA: hypothetical protein ACQ7VA_006981, partial [Burkholderia sola]
RGCGERVQVKGGKRARRADSINESGMSRTAHVRIGEFNRMTPNAKYSYLRLYRCALNQTEHITSNDRASGRQAVVRSPIPVYP